MGHGPSRRSSTGWDVKRLNGVDALMLYSETPEIHMHTLKIGVLDVSGGEGGFSFELFRELPIRGSWLWCRFASSWWTSR